jgi:hypothetical protein
MNVTDMPTCTQVLKQLFIVKNRNWFVELKEISNMIGSLGEHKDSDSRSSETRLTILGADESATASDLGAFQQARE